MIFNPASNNWFQLIEGVCLDLPAVGLVSAGKVRLSLRITAEDPLEPVQAGLAKLPTVGIEQGTTVTDI